VRIDSVRLAVVGGLRVRQAFTRRGTRTGKGYVAHIPDAVLHANDREVYAAFMRGLYEADGDTSAGYPTLKNTSVQMVRDVQSILLASAFRPRSRSGDRTRELELG
jgi:hypothetical protein